MESKKSSKNNFFRKNMYYLVLAFVLLSVVAVSVALYVRRNESQNALNNSGSGDIAARPNDSSDILPPDDSSSENPPEEKPNDVPTQTVITFALPLENFNVSCDYTEASVVYNQTLNVYTGHMAIDFSAEYGEAVKAVYGGTIESITTSYLTGTTVTIAHGNNLKTVYNSIEVKDGLVEGANVEQGFVIGYVSDNNRQEYKDGPHLHFEVWENGEKISPYKYITVSEK